MLPAHERPCAQERVLRGETSRTPRRALVSAIFRVHARPPVGVVLRSGLVGTVSCGFCIFNSVAIGALYALEKYKPVAR